MEAFLVSTVVVALAEVGDKTQLLALVLAARFGRPVPIALGILVATIANHAAAGLAGTWLAGALPTELLRWGLGLSFLAVAVWALVPDKFEESDQPARRWDAFLATLVSFFLVEIGDKTQVATVGLAIKYQTLVPVVLGTTLGMMAANLPVVVAGQALARRLPVKAIRIVAAAIFAALGVAVLAGFELG